MHILTVISSPLASPPPRLPRRTASAFWTRRSTRGRRSSRRPRATSATRWLGSTIRSPPWWTRWTDRCVSRRVAEKSFVSFFVEKGSFARVVPSISRATARVPTRHSSVPLTDTRSTFSRSAPSRTSHSTRRSSGGARGAREAARGGQAQPGSGGVGAAETRLRGEVRGRARAAAGTRASAGGVRVAAARQGGARGAHRAHERSRVVEYAFVVYERRPFRRLFVSQSTSVTWLKNPFFVFNLCREPARNRSPGTSTRARRSGERFAPPRCSRLHARREPRSLRSSPRVDGGRRAPPDARPPACRLVFRSPPRPPRVTKGRPRPVRDGERGAMVADAPAPRGGPR